MKFSRREGKVEAKSDANAENYQQAKTKCLATGRRLDTSDNEQGIEHAYLKEPALIGLLKHIGVMPSMLVAPMFGEPDTK